MNFNRSRLVIAAALCLAATGFTAYRGSAEPTVSAPATSTAPAVKYEITIDISEVPEMKEWAAKLQLVLDAWYPKIVAMLPSDGYTAPRKFTVTIKKEMDGVAYTSGSHVVGASKWFLAHPDDQGAIVHEMAHVVQAYRGRNNPGWLVEGVADYVRWFNYEPEEKHPKPNPKKAKYTDSYQVTGAFLNYVVKTHDKDFVTKINADMRNSKYSVELWKTYTGKTVEELWEEYMGTLKK